MPPKFSIVIPARNEERLMPACLESIRIAASPFPPEQVEIIVVLNRCTDKTEEIAHSAGARTVREDVRNLAGIRNTGARAATGVILITIDADSTMSPGTLTAIDREISSGHMVGGGTQIRPDRSSPGIQVTMWLFAVFVFLSRFSGGLFWCLRQDFEAIGGFNENLLSAEDLDFARRLNAHGKQTRRRFITLPGNYIVTSSRKFDALGDWCVLTNPRLIWRIFTGRHREATDAFYYDFPR